MSESVNVILGFAIGLIIIVLIISILAYHDRRIDRLFLEPKTTEPPPPQPVFRYTAPPSPVIPPLSHVPPKPAAPRKPRNPNLARIKCPQCDHMISINKNGTLRVHGTRTGYYGLECAASGMKAFDHVIYENPFA